MAAIFAHPYFDNSMRSYFDNSTTVLTPIDIVMHEYYCESPRDQMIAGGHCCSLTHSSHTCTNGANGTSLFSFPSLPTVINDIDMLTPPASPDSERSITKENEDTRRFSMRTVSMISFVPSPVPPTSRERILSCTSEMWRPPSPDQEPQFLAEVPQRDPGNTSPNFNTPSSSASTVRPQEYDLASAGDITRLDTPRPGSTPFPTQSHFPSKGDLDEREDSLFAQPSLIFHPRPRADALPSSRSPTTSWFKSFGSAISSLSSRMDETVAKKVKRIPPAIKILSPLFGNPLVKAVNGDEPQLPSPISTNHLTAPSRSQVRRLQQEAARLKAVPLPIDDTD